MIRPTWKRAFTLIELLMVIILIAVMSAVVIPSYIRYLTHVRFQDKVRDVQDLFAYAREEAVTLNTTVTLHFDQQTESFTVNVTPASPQNDEPAAYSSAENMDAANAQSAPAQRSVQLDSSETVNPFTISGNPAGTSSSVTAPNIATSPTDLHFLEDGTVEGMTMTVKNAEGAYASFTLWPSTARLTMDSSQGIR